MTDLRPYPAYKNSGVRWLGDVPEHWEVRRGKNIFRCIDVRSETGEEELLTVSSERGVVPRRSANVTMFKADSYVGHKQCWPGDLVINSLWAWARGLGVSRYHGIISTAYGVYRPKEIVDARFIHELVRSIPFHWELRVRSRGVWTSRLQLTDDSFLCAPFPLPPLPEQTAIVGFLDHVDRRIRHYIRAKQKLIGLLEEQKQAIIHRAVTRGLDPDVPLKPSGVEWLGDVPEGWRVVRAKYLGKIISGFAFNSMDFAASGVRVLKIANVKTMSLDWTDESFLPEHFFEKYSSFSIRDGDMVFALTRPIISTGLKAAVAEINGERVLLNQRNAVFRTNKDLRTEFMYYLVFSRYFVADFENRIDFTGQQPNISPLSIGAIAIALPQLDEQAAIVEYLDKATADIDTAIDRARREIELLREYRTRLVADVVTGKLDVREASASAEATADRATKLSYPAGEVD